MIKNRKKLLEEFDGIPLSGTNHTEWIGLFLYPFVNVRLYYDFMIIGYGRRIQLYHNEVTEFVPYQYYRVIVKGITMIHNRADVPKRVIVFGVSENNKILDTLKTKVNVF